MTALAIAAAVLLGALTQRLTGVGFALVASPLLVLVLGPTQGVVITNVFAAATAALVFLRHVREVEYRRVLPLLAAAGLAVIPGALLALRVEPAVLSVTAGCLILVALALSVVARRIPRVRTWQGQAVAGGLSGFMNVLAGVGGPPITAYAIASSWDHRRFAVSVQFYFFALGTMSLLARGVVPALPPIDAVAAVLALVGGLAAGRWLRPRVPLRVASRGGVALALLGAVTVVVRGVVELATA